MVKPEPGIYRTCLESLGLEGRKVLFLDDNPENVEGARQSGIESLLFRSLPEVLDKIIQLGLLPKRLGSVSEVP